MTVLSGVMHDDREALDEETLKFLLDIAPQNTWDESYLPGSFNAIKWAEGTDVTPIENVGAAGVISMCLRACQSSPSSACHAFLALMACPHSIVDINTTRIRGIDWPYTKWGLSCSIDDNDLGVVQQGVPVLATLLRAAVIVTRLFPVSTVFWHVGFVEIVLLAIAAADKDGWGGIALATPLFCYNLGTSLLLTGADFRFFWLNFPIGLLLALYLLFRNGMSMQREGDDEP